MKDVNVDSQNFTSIADLIPEWGLPTAHERLAKRAASELTDIQSSHARIVPHMEDIIEFLNQFPLREIPEEYLPLSYLALAAIEADDAVHLWKNATPRFADDITRWGTKSSFYS